MAEAANDNLSDFAYLDTVDEVLRLVMFYCEEARHSQTQLAIGVNLKMASRAMRCALELYGDHSEQKRKEKQSENV